MEVATFSDEAITMAPRAFLVHCRTASHVFVNEKLLIQATPDRTHRCKLSSEFIAGPDEPELNKNNHQRWLLLLAGLLRNCRSCCPLLLFPQILLPALSTLGLHPIYPERVLSTPDIPIPVTLLCSVGWGFEGGGVRLGLRGLESVQGFRGLRLQGLRVSGLNIGFRVQGLGLIGLIGFRVYEVRRQG